MNEKTKLFLLPSVDHLLSRRPIQALMEQFSSDLVKRAVRESLHRIRKKMVNAKAESPKTRDEIVALVLQEVGEEMDRLLHPGLRPVINATGVILHTGLGRAPVSTAAQEAVRIVLAGYCNLELDLISGERGERNDHVSGLLRRLTGSEAALMVNNNAAAVLLTLNALCDGKKVLVSRGQLIEIGGSFRLPDVMNKSGAIMKEVGTTNKTRLRDYEKAMEAEVGAIFVAHTSNYRILGFTEEPALPDLVHLAHQHKIPLIHDLGGGVLVDLRHFGLPYEPLVQDSLKAGADVVTFSGDKVLGGPQAGIIVGKRKFIRPIMENPLMRVVRCDKLAIAAMEATLRLYLRAGQVTRANRTLSIFHQSAEQIHERGRKLMESLTPTAKNHWRINLIKSDAQAGSGALPLEKLSSWALVLIPSSGKAGHLAQQLRCADPPIVGYVQNDKVFLDLRTVDDEELTTLRDVLNHLSTKPEPNPRS